MAGTPPPTAQPPAPVPPSPTTAAVAAGESTDTAAALASGFVGRLLLALRGPRTPAAKQEGALRIGILGAGKRPAVCSGGGGTGPGR